MSIEEIATYLRDRGVAAKEFWLIAMGGDMAPLEREAVDRIIAAAELGRAEGRGA